MSLKGKKGLIVGIANEHSIAYGCAEMLRAQGTELTASYLNAKAEPYVRPLAERLECTIIVSWTFASRANWRPCSCACRRIAASSISCSTDYAPREVLHCRMADCSQEEFSTTMAVSCHSFIRMARLAEPLMARWRVPSHRDVLRLGKGRRGIQFDGQ